MTTYIYLNRYPNGYLYVGSHTWEGPVGEVDPSYEGSSTIAEIYKWHPKSIEILESDVSDKLNTEKYWIRMYASKFGIAKVAFNHCSSNSARVWCLKYSQDGLLLNCHDNEPPHDKISLLKSKETQRRNGTFGDMSQCHTPEARAKRVKTSIENGSFARFHKAGMEAARKPEARSKRGWTLIENGKSKLAVVTKGSEIICVDSLRRACEFIGKPSLRGKLSKVDECDLGDLKVKVIPSGEIIKWKSFWRVYENCLD